MTQQMSSEGSSNEENLFLNTGILKECINVCATRKLYKVIILEVCFSIRLYWICHGNWKGVRLK